MAIRQKRWLLAMLLGAVAIASYAGVIIRIGMDSP